MLSEHSLAEDAGYGDPSATYWGVYASEARISDKKFVHTLISDTKAMSLLVSSNSGAPRSAPS